MLYLAVNLGLIESKFDSDSANIQYTPFHFSQTLPFGTWYSIGLVEFLIKFQKQVRNKLFK